MTWERIAAAKPPARKPSRARPTRDIKVDAFLALHATDPVYHYGADVKVDVGRRRGKSRDRGRTEHHIMMSKEA